MTTVQFDSNRSPGDMIRDIVLGDATRTMSLEHAILAYLNLRWTHERAERHSPPSTERFGYHDGDEKAFQPTDYVLYQERVFQICFWSATERQYFVGATDDANGVRSAWVYACELSRYLPRRELRDLRIELLHALRTLQEHITEPYRSETISTRIDQLRVLIDQQ